MPLHFILVLALAGSAESEAPCAAEGRDAAREEARLELERGRALLDASSWPEAEAALLSAIRLDPASPFPHYALGLALSGQKRHADAALAFARCRDALRCLRADPTALESFRGRLDREIRELQGAIGELERSRLKRAAIPGQEMNGAAPPNLGQSTQAMHALEQRLSDLRALRQHPDREPVGIGVAIGNAWFLAGDLALAEAGFRSALGAEPDNADARHNLGMVLLFAGQLDEAERQLKAADKAGVKTDPRLKEELKRRRAASRP